jgi:hypothetical protein
MNPQPLNKEPIMSDQISSATQGPRSHALSHGADVTRPPMPLLRTSMTVAPPGGPPVTLQVLILADGFPAEATADLDDVSELQEAGWMAQGHGSLTVYLRTVS